MKKVYFFLLGFFTIVTSGSLSAQVISPARRVDWAFAGYRADEPANLTFRNITDYGGLGDNSTPNDLALQNAISSLANQNGVVYFPSGTFLFNAPVQLRSGLVLRGQSSATSILKFDLGGSENLISISGSVSDVIANITSSLSKNDTSFIVDDAGLFKVGDYIKLYQNDSALIQSTWALESVGQILNIKKISGNVITFSSALRRSYFLTNAPKIRRVDMATDVGIEFLKIKRMDATISQSSNLFFSNAARCWVNGIESDSCNFAHIEIANSNGISVTGSFFHGAFAYGGGGQGYGISCEYTSGECLVENNIFRHLRHSMVLQSGANGNVFGYNYSIQPNKSEAYPYDLAGDIVLHGNYPYANLFEGNIVQNIIVDASHYINGPLNTFFRNRAESYGLIMSSGAGDSSNIVGNEITATAFGKGNYVITGSGNLEYGNNKRGVVVPSGTTLLDDKSYYYSSVPLFWTGSGNWPSIGIANSINSGSIPAKERYLASNNLTSSSPYLSGLSLTRGQLSPVFSPDVVSYTASVYGNTVSVVVKASSSDPGAFIKVNDTNFSDSMTVSLMPGINVITIVVTAKDGISKKTYKITLSGKATALTFQGKIFMYGAYNAATGLMNTKLNASGVLEANALSQPYTSKPFNHPGSEHVSSGFFAAHPGIVDWVLVELRNASTPSAIVATRAVFVAQDGRLVDINGSDTNITFPDVANADYYVVIRHRNHLGIRSAMPVDFTSGTGTFDFTTSSTNSYQNKNYTSTIQTGNIWAMRGGDANSDGNVKYTGPSNDANQILNLKLGGSLSNSLLQVYLAEDVNMDGVLKGNGVGNDQNFLLNIVFGGSISSLFYEQL